MPPELRPAFADPYPADAYLLRKERRFRVWALDKTLDLGAVAMVAKILPFAAGIPQIERDRLGRAVNRIAKAATVSPDAFVDARFGFPIVVEVPMGGTRSGVSAEGQTWAHVMDGAGYGFLPDTIARDAEPIDMIVGPDSSATSCFILAQAPCPPSPGMALAIDEYKLGVGFLTVEDFAACYARNWPPALAGDISCMPLEVLRGLLGFELDEGVVVKSLRAVSTGGVVVVSSTGALFGGVQLVRKGISPEQQRRNDGASGTPAIDPPPVESAAPVVSAGPINVGIFSGAGGGARLPGQGAPRVLRGKVYDELVKAAALAATKAARCAKAWSSATDFQGDTKPLADAPELASHPALTAEPTFGYDPDDVNGWAGGIEPEDEAWICFFDVSGRCLLWTQRDEDGGIVGLPYEFQRPDLAQPQLAAQGAAKAKSRRTAKILPVAKGLNTTTPVDRRVVKGVVLEPEPFDGQGDAHDETYSAAVIEIAAHQWLASFRNIDDEHGRFFRSDEVVPVESYIAEQDTMIAGTAIKAGAWVLAVKILSDVVWARVLRGELTAFSIEGYAARMPNVPGAA